MRNLCLDILNMDTNNAQIEVSGSKVLKKQFNNDIVNIVKVLG